MSSDAGDGGFMSRWSRRKAAASAADAPPADHAATARPEAAASEPPAPAGPEPTPALSAEELAALPPVEAASCADDLAGYLRRGVPAALRLAALRRIWTLNPAISGHVDPALDYAFDFNTPGAAPWAPLAQDFDARAAADRLFGPAGTRTRGEAVEGAAPDSGRRAEADADEGSSLPRAGDSPSLEASPAPDGLRRDVALTHGSDGASAHGPAVAPAEGRTERRPARRHGGALPV
ncbi:MAG: DUF3306 domain-containing protein [Rubrimonas sp.]